MGSERLMKVMGLDGSVGGEVKRAALVAGKALWKWDPVPGQSLPSMGRRLCSGGDIEEDSL